MKWRIVLVTASMGLVAAGFAIGETAITRAQYAAFVRTTCPFADQSRIRRCARKPGHRQDADHRVPPAFAWLLYGQNQIDGNNALGAGVESLH